MEISKELCCEKEGERKGRTWRAEIHTKGTGRESRSRFIGCLLLPILPVKVYEMCVYVYVFKEGNERG